MNWSHPTPKPVGDESENSPESRLANKTSALLPKCRGAVGPWLGTGRLRQVAMEEDRGDFPMAPSPQKPYLSIRDGTGRDGSQRVSRPPRSTSLAPLRCAIRERGGSCP
jgi:hypothetical protein